jgi:hypothetical protein
MSSCRCSALLFAYRTLLDGAGAEVATTRDAECVEEFERELAVS